MTKKQTILGASALIVSALALVTYLGAGGNQLGTDSPAPPAPSQANLDKTNPDLPEPGRTDNRGSSTESTTPVTHDWRSELGTPPNFEAQPRHQIDREVPLVEKYDELVDKSMAGDSDAAMELAGSLSHCHQSPRNQEQLDQRLNVLSQTRRVEGNVAQVNDLDSAVQEVVSKYDYCEGISKDRTLDHFVHMKIAADNGNMEAKIKLLTYGPMDMEDRELAYQRVWEDKNAMNEEALRHMFDAAEAGYSEAISLVGKRLSDGSGKLSIVEAAAYRIAGGHMQMLNGTVDSDWVQRRLNRVVNELRASDAQAAIVLARKMLESEECCTYLERSNN